MEIRFQIPSAAVESSIREEFARGYRIEEIERSGSRLGLLDTFDWRVVRSGHRLFSWSRDGSIHVGIHGANGWLGQPFAVEEVPSFEWDLDEWELHKILKSWIKMRRLTERVELDLRWKRFAALDREGKQRLRFRFERIRAFATPDGTRRRLPLTLVIEPLKGYEKEALRAAGWLAEQFGVLESRQHPFVEALARVGVAPDPFRKRSVPMHGAAPIGVILGRLLSESWRVMTLHRDGVLKPDDTEYLHDFRVALRRSRSVLSQLRSAFPPVEHRRFRKAFKRLGDRTGAVRDLDVHLLELEARLREEDQDGAARIEPLRAVLQTRWKNAQRKLARELKSKRYALLEADWPAFLESAPTWEGEAQQPVLEAASLRIRETYAEVIARGSVIQSETPDDALHQLRLHCKKLRYLLEFFAPLYPAKQLDRFVTTLKGLQEILGDFNDLFVQRETLNGLLDSEPSLPEATREWMAEQARRSKTLQAKARDSFAEAFAELARPKTRKQVVKIFQADSLAELDQVIAEHAEQARMALVIAEDALDEALDEDDASATEKNSGNGSSTKTPSAKVNRVGDGETPS